MARNLNEEKYTERRNEILDAALKLVYTKGYEHMTIQNILDELHISKGAFYHYFDSKGDVLEAMVERMIVEQVTPLLKPIVDDAKLSALDKFHCFYQVAGQWKITQKTFMLELLQVWMSDENAIVRQKLMSSSIQSVAPMLTEIIHQGVSEGVFTSPYPDQTANIIIYIMEGLSEKLTELLILAKTDRAEGGVDKEINIFIGALNDAIERVLGAPKASIKLIDPEMLKVWFE
ncbi:MAG: TetR/AcrR family transcriptional regulator [Anaerolineales bacterium]|nr:TetR/AcrR family transcriptional regulator [Anaerolineales bacterium]